MMRPPSPPRPVGAPAARRQSVPNPGVERGDHVYVRHPQRGPMAVKVVATGRDGMTAQCAEGKQHRLPYDTVLGHKARMLHRYKVVDQGADGALLEDATGRRRYLAGEVPNAAAANASEGASAVASKLSSEAKDDPITGGMGRLKKALTVHTNPLPVLFLKAMPGGHIKDRPGLSLKDVTDRAGHQTKRWVRTMKDQPKGDRPTGPAEHPEAGAPMRHGDTVSFRHGDVEGRGKITASGADGVTVQDDAGREHQVRHEHLVKPEGAGQQPTGAKPPALPQRQEGEDDKGYAKRVAAETPDPESLPEEHGKYFNTDKATHTVAMDKLRSSKTDAENEKGGRNAAKLMHAAYHGALAKRDPIEVHEDGQGGYQVKDGNGTLTAAQRHGWKQMPVRVVPKGDSGGASEGASSQEPEKLVAALFDEREIASLPKDAPQPAKTQDELYTKAPEALDQLQTWLDKGKGVSSAMGHKLMTKSPDDVTDAEWDSPDGMLFIAPLKGAKRAAEKVAADYGGDWSQLRDVVRCSIAVPKLEDLHQVMERLKASGMKLAMKPKNRFVKPVPVGYRDLLMNVTLPNGMIAEVQLHAKPMLKAKNEGHHWYEIERSIDAKCALEGREPTEEETAQLTEAQAKQRDIYGAAWQQLAGRGAGAGAQMAKALKAGRFRFYEREGARFRGPAEGPLRGVRDVLLGGKWQPYKGDDRLHPALFGEEIPDPLASSQASEGAPLRKAMLLIFR